MAMEITLENIDVLRKRANLSYSAAAELLVKYDGDVVKALTALEKEQKLKPEGNCLQNSTLWQKAKNILAKSNQTKFIITKDEQPILNISLTIAIIFAVISLPLAIAAIVLALITNCRIRFAKNNGEECRINSKLAKVAESVSTTANKISQEIKNA